MWCRNDSKNRKWKRRDVQSHGREVLETWIHAWRNTVDDWSVKYFRQEYIKVLN
jgi:hypothetical protein